MWTCIGMSKIYLIIFGNRNFSYVIYTVILSILKRERERSKALLRSGSNVTERFRPEKLRNGNETFRSDEERWTVWNVSKTKELRCSKTKRLLKLGKIMNFPFMLLTELFKKKMKMKNSNFKKKEAFKTRV